MLSLIKIRDGMRLAWAILWGWLYIPHLLLAQFTSNRDLILSDIERMKTKINITLPDNLALLYLLHNNTYYRSIFYHRLGAVKSIFIRWYRPADNYFIISNSTKIGPGFLIIHPYATIINAESIGENFTCIQCTTMGDKNDMRPIIGNNVTLGANVNIIGNVRIGNNVTIGAGSVVVKDIPDNCIAAGNPARVIKTLSNG